MMRSSLLRNALVAGTIAATAFSCSKSEDSTKPADDTAGAATGETEPSGEDKAETMRVGLVFDVGGLGDQSFNDSAHRGLKKAEEELGVEINYFEPSGGADRETGIRQYAAEGYDLVLGIGFMFSDDITKLAKQFPDVKFAAVDYSLPAGETEPPANLAGLRFREHEGSFLVGAVAGMLTETKKVGFVGGMKTPLIRKFEAGYEAGVKEVCAECEILSGYAGVEPSAFNDPTKGKELALTQYSRGADIIYHASGNTGTGVFNAAKQEGKLAIGVDSDQYHLAPCCVVTSMLKRVDVAVFEIIKAAKEGTYKGGIREFGLAEDGVAYVHDDNNKERVTEELQGKVEALREKIVAGEIAVPAE
ncbi:BMP family lipoprotein [Haliangium ochraceum]|uniref:Basic membrane lipoprotein n=1 Tax=Haliangium ochraceum (strain DSM 14365 / JCM 11303 / SMP-2) TaxID=502025 RepID=D0LT67_HALO1|nr:BMP family ABC transporter substrate-binding protein [Haliangium ochraceum]ACY19203.1 basic membrane lipoprotein [Haliangium ochraceum DSM 14365]